MGVLYLPYFDVSETVVGSFGTITLDDGVHSDIVVDIGALTSTDQASSGTSSIYNHKGGTFTNIILSGPLNTDIRFPHYSGTTFPIALRTALRAAATTNSWTDPNNITVTFSTATARYTIAHTSTAFSITWANQATRELLGFAGNSASATSHTGTKTPLFCVACTLGDVSHETDFYEPDGIGNHVLTDGGHGHGINRTESPKFKDWVQEFETKYKTHRLYGVFGELNDPFTLEHLYEYCRGEWPFVLYGDSRDGAFGVPEVYNLRTDGMSFRPKRATPGNDTQFHTPFECVFKGTVGIAAV